MPAALRADDYRHVLAVLEECERADTLPAFLASTLDAVDEHLGFSTSAFMLALASDGPGERAYAGRVHGQPDYVLEEYFERWADRDPLASGIGRACYLRDNAASIDAIYASLDHPRRAFVDDFLRRTRQREQISVWLDTGSGTDGFLTPMRDHEFTARDRACLAVLRPHLTNILRRHVAPGLEPASGPPLSMRERDVAELVTAGFSNREIAAVLHIEEDTVKKHVSHAMAKLGAHRRTQLAVAWATGSAFHVRGMVGPASPA